MAAETATEQPVTPGAHRLDAYLPLLENKRVGLVVNHTSMVHQTHLVDTLIGLGIHITTIFAPEHGFRGQADAGDEIASGKDTKTGLPVLSLYGQKKKPTAQDLENTDILVFDIQDVGARFYTYISTLQYVMQGLAEVNKPLIILDRPNPNGHYIDGPVLDTAFRSFVGMNPVPVVYGMTMGEYGKMVNGENWNKRTCDLTVIPCLHYDHNTAYTLPVKPSPNLPNQVSVMLYPGTCFFEGTIMSIGRGTLFPFQITGHPDFPDKEFSFTPVSMSGAKNPPLKDTLCYGINLTHLSVDSLFENRRLDLTTLLTCFNKMNPGTFFNAKWFDTLAGGSSFRLAILSGKSEAEIRAGWQKDLDTFRQVRKKYLLYKDFE